MLADLLSLSSRIQFSASDSYGIFEFSACISVLNLTDDLIAVVSEQVHYQPETETVWFVYIYLYMFFVLGILHYYLYYYYLLFYVLVKLEKTQHGRIERCN